VVSTDKGYGFITQDDTAGTCSSITARSAARGRRASLKARGSSTRSSRGRKGRRHVTCTPSPQPDLADEHA